MTPAEATKAILAPYGGLRGLCNQMEAVLNRAERTHPAIVPSADGKTFRIKALPPYPRKESKVG
jgi:hypothetical protein